MKWTFRILGILIAVLLVFAGIVYYKARAYKMFELKADPADFGNPQTRAEYRALAEELVSQMSFEEKIDQMYGERMITSAPKMGINFMIHKRFPHVYVGKNERLNIPPWVLSDGPRGSRVMDKKIHGVTTFPVAMSRGASWNVALESRIHEVIAKEIRANKANYAATPCINLLRHPAWGRAQETYGEDPWLLGEFGTVAVQALEKHQVMACPKHYALNSIDNSRFVVDVKVEERTLREVYLPHFKKTLQQGKPASLMSAYNLANGEYCSANAYLLQTILRDEWGFDGFVTSDWVAGTPDGPGAINAGLNVEMPWQQSYAYDTIRKALKEGVISQERIDELVVQSLSTRLKYAFAEDAMPYEHDLIACEEHTSLAREAAEEGMVLMKNDGVLPFDSSPKQIAVIGRLGDMVNLGDHASSDAQAAYAITPFQGIQNFFKGSASEVVFNDASDPDAAEQLATQSDQVILVVGYTYEDEGEYLIMDRSKMEESAKAGKAVGKKGIGGDRENLRLKPEDEALIARLAGSNEKLVVVFVGGSAIDMSPWADKVPSILFSWYAGMEGGNALANILYGQVNPSGKLPFSIAQNAEDYPYFTPYTTAITYDYYHGYTLFDKKGITPAYPFGYGLSYTEFRYDSLNIQNPVCAEGDSLHISVNVSNVGDRDGKEVSQLYVGFGNTTVDRPLKLLRDFAKTEIKSGQTVKINLSVAVKDLAWYNPDTKTWEVEKMAYELYVGGSSDKQDLLVSTFKVE